MIQPIRDSQNGGDPPAGRSPSAPTSTPPPDPRVAAFAEYIAAVDRSDVSAAKAASRTLRTLGFSVVPTATPGGGGGR